VSVKVFRAALLCGTLAVAAVALASATGSATLGSASDTVRVAGSGYTMPRFTVRWAEAFTAKTGIQVEVEGKGTSTGPPALIRGKADIASMTRPMSNAELTAFHRRFGHLPTPIPVAADAVAVFVNERNPLERLTLIQVDAIFSKTRRCGAAQDAQVWGDLGLEGEWADRSIGLYGRRPGSGTGTYFRDAALCGGKFKDWMRVSPGRDSAAFAISEAVYGIGFASFADRRKGMKALALAPRRGEPYGWVEATDIYSDTYPLGRQLYFYVNREPNSTLDPSIAAFISYALSEEAQSMVHEAGYLRLPPALVKRILAGAALAGAPQ
jgi:phosphate transport system substrate-binding protein